LPYVKSEVVERTPHLGKAVVSRIDGFKIALKVLDRLSCAQQMKQREGQ